MNDIQLDNPIAPFHSMLRWFMSGTIAVLLAVSAVYFMQTMVNQNHDINKQEGEFDIVNVVRLERKTETETRERRLPEKPEPKQVDNKPVQNIMESMAEPIETPDFDLQPMALPTGIAGGPKLGGMTFGSGGFNPDRSVVPVSRIHPRYPRLAARRGIEGDVTLQFTITETGLVTNIKVVDANPAGLFEQAAKDALSRWKYKAKTLDGKPVTQFAEVIISFRLEK